MNKPLTLMAGLILLTHGLAQADVVTDGSLGATANLSGPDFQIDANLGTQAGGNLFHSFHEFSVASGESATFNGPASVNNIISRVTGGSASQIDGTLRSTIQGADLYLINPKGVLFGKDAQVNVPGALYVSTADQLSFADDAVFSASLGGADTLTVAAPSSFGFLTPSPANIQINAEHLAADPGKGLHFVGGDIEINVAAAGKLGIYADSGEISLVSSGGNNQVNLVDGRPELDGQAGGNISLSGNALVEVNTFSDRDAGNLFIQADTLSLSGQAKVESDTKGGGNAGSISVEVKTLTLSGDTRLSSSTESAGDAGLIDIKADRINLGDQAVIVSDTKNEGNTGDAGNIFIQTQILTLSGEAHLNSSTVNAGDAGRVDIKADQINLNDQTLIEVKTETSTSIGNGGFITIQANTLALAGQAKIESDTLNAKDAGNILIQVETLTLSGDTRLSSSTENAGDAGLIDITAGQINLSGQALVVSDTLGVGNTGNAGDIVIQAKTFNMSGRTDLSTSTVNSGDAGRIEIKADQINLSDQALIASDTFGSGHAGLIDLQADQFIKMTGRASVNSVAHEKTTGLAGNIHIKTPYLSIVGQGDTDADGDAARDSAKITVDTKAGSTGLGGFIRIESNRIHLENGATITVKSEGSGDAGYIDINGNGRLEAKKSFISAESVNADGGNVDINTRLVVLDSSHIKADSAGANGGRLDIQSTLVRTPDSTTTARGVAQAQDGEVIITDEINPDQALLDLELGFLANEIKSPCSVVVAEEGVVLNVNFAAGCGR